MIKIANGADEKVTILVDKKSEKNETRVVLKNTERRKIETKADIEIERTKMIEEVEEIKTAKKGEAMIEVIKIAKKEETMIELIKKEGVMIEVIKTVKKEEAMIEVIKTVKKEEATIEVKKTARTEEAMIEEIKFRMKREAMSEKKKTAKKEEAMIDAIKAIKKEEAAIDAIKTREIGTDIAAAEIEVAETEVAEGAEMGMIGEKGIEDMMVMVDEVIGEVMNEVMEDATIHPGSGKGLEMEVRLLQVGILGMGRGTATIAIEGD